MHIQLCSMPIQFPFPPPIPTDIHLAPSSAPSPARIVQVPISQVSGVANASFTPPHCSAPSVSDTNRNARNAPATLAFIANANGVRIKYPCRLLACIEIRCGLSLDYITSNSSSIRHRCSRRVRVRFNAPSLGDSDGVAKSCSPYCVRLSVGVSADFMDRPPDQLLNACASAREASRTARSSSAHGNN